MLGTIPRRPAEELRHDRGLAAVDSGLPAVKVLVTGASGFLGRHLCERLRRDHDVVGLCRRPGSEEGSVAGDVLDPQSLSAPLDGVDALVHAAGAVSHRPEDAEWLYDVHVRGTQNVLAAAQAAGVQRIVHVSSSGTVAVSRDERPLDESAPEALELVRGWPYYRSKIFAEQLALAAGAIVVGPSLLLGPGDRDGSSTRAVQLLLDGELPALPSGGLSFVDVRDAADGIARALEQGEPGQRYLLGGSNLTFSAFYERLARAAGVDAPRWRLPSRTRSLLGLLPGALTERLADRFGLDPIELEMASCFWYVDASRAKQELGWEPRDPGDTLHQTIEYLRGNRSESIGGETRPRKQ